MNNNIMKKKIFFVMNKLGGQGWGGAHRVSVILANYLLKKGYDVTIIVWLKSSVDYPIDEGVKVICLNFQNIKGKNRLKACLKTRELIKGNRGANIFVLISRMAVDIYIFSRFLGIYLIGSERTDPNSEPKKKIYKMIKNIAFFFINKTGYQTNDAKEYFPKMAQKKGTVIPNPLSPNLPKPFHGERKKQFVTFCRIDKQKNLPLMIDSFIEVHKKHPDFILKIYGNGIIEKEIREYIEKNNAQKYIILNDFLKSIHNEILDSYGFISSSDYEGMSNSMLEALAIGLPCICTDCPIGGAKMIIKDGLNGLLVPVKDKEAMVKAINRLIENPELANKLSKEAIKIREKLDQDRICEEWEKLL